MKAEGTPTLDPREAKLLLQELLSRRPAFLPEWLPVKNSPSWAILEIFVRYLQAIIGRLNQAPDKNLLAFLDMLGLELLPAQAARAPVVFQALPGAGDARIPAGTRLGAEAAGQSEPVRFETARTIAFTGARLVEVKTVWPAQDEYADHTSAMAGGRPFTLFKAGQPVAHEIYLSHETLFAFNGVTTLEVAFDLALKGSTSLNIAWEYWDGQVWRGFRPFELTNQQVSQDGTSGLTRSGVITLQAECGKSVATRVHGLDGYWIRGRLDQPLPPDPAMKLPEVDQIRLRAVILRPLPKGCLAGLTPDQAFTGGTRLDLTKSFFPLGRQPDQDSVLYLSCEEAFSKPGAQVTLCFQAVQTHQQEADGLTRKYEVDVNKAKERLKKTVLGLADTIGNAAKVVRNLAKQYPSPLKFQEQPLNDFDTNNNNLNQSGKELATIDELPQVWNAIKKVRDNALKVSDAIKNITVGLVYSWGIPIHPNISEIASNIDNAKKNTLDAVASAINSLEVIVKLSPLQAAAAGGQPPPQLSSPKLAWEYWNGKGWQVLQVAASPPEAENFLAAGELSFVIPADFQTVSVNNSAGRWLRVRLAEGSFYRLRLVSWYDATNRMTNFFPVIESRPPLIKGLFLGYTYRSAWERPDNCLTYNDFQFDLRSQEARWPGKTFPPFRTMADVMPALYLGFDRPLPNDSVSLYLDLEENESPTPPLEWEGWDGKTWQQLDVIDETAHFSLPGMVSFIAPAISPRPQAAISQAGGLQISVTDPLEAAVFQPGDLLFVRSEDTSETAVIREITQTLVMLETPLTEKYPGGTMALAPLPRFGSPRDWVRARLRGGEGPPALSRFYGIHLNAVWSLQVQTIENELLGSATSEPGLTFFFTQIPVLPGEEIEVRELEGRRAAIEFPLLQEELWQQGFTAEDLRLVQDPRTDLVTEVWVRWQHRPHLFFSGPEDRHYQVERARGRLIFGDGHHGKLPPVGANNIKARRYRSGGGLLGNVPPQKITQILGPAPFVEKVFNPKAGDGGAPGEDLEEVRVRGPEDLRHRWRSLAARDYEALARESTRGVAAARALPATAPNGRPAPGYVTVIIVPRSQEAQPQPSLELRQRVRDYLLARAPATVLPEHLAVIGPTYLPVGVAARVAPLKADEAGMVEDRLRLALAAFLHPLDGGPEGRGWPFGRNVYLSDLARVAEEVTGVDYVRELNLLLDDVPQGEYVAVPPDRMVVAGTCIIEVEARESSRR